MSDQPRRRDFARVVRDEMLAQDEYVTALGAPNYAAFIADVDGLNYESARKALTGDRWPSNTIMEKIAAALKIEPRDFWEWRLNNLRDQLDPNIDVEQAYTTLRVLEEAVGED